MNYIGHSLISLEKNKENLFGNFSGDFYKGRIEELVLPDNIKEGVILHRQIDTVTDTNNRLVNEINEKTQQNMNRAVIKIKEEIQKVVK